MVLTKGDIHAIARIVGEHHVCRYNVPPADMSDLMGFVRQVRDARDETQRTFRTAVIRIIVYGSIAGFIALLEIKFRWVRPLLRWITGAPG